MLRLALLTLFALLSSTTASAQITPQPGSGCPGVVPPMVTGSPSLSGTLTIQCSTGDQDSLCLAANRVTLIGGCSAVPVPIDPPLGCSAGCALLVSPSFGSFAETVVLAPPSLPVGFTMCIQCGCIADYGSGACIELSDAVSVTIQP